MLPKPVLFVREAERLFDGAGTLTDQATRESLTAVLAAFANWIDVVAGAERRISSIGV